MGKSLAIKNVGSIKEVSFEIKKVNVFMGKQSSGKSTIAKILSFCSWVEKYISFRQSIEKYLNKPVDFIREIENFHKMENYFSKESYIEYVGDAIKITYQDMQINFEWLVTRYDYQRPKISYIPSERSMIILPEMEKMELPNNYLKSYLFDWLTTRKNYPLENKFSLLDTNIQYYFSEEARESHIVSDGYNILLSQSSSGMQSLIPLLTMVENLVENLYLTDRESSSYELESIKNDVTNSLFLEFIMVPFMENNKNLPMEEINLMLNDKIRNKDKQVMLFVERFNAIVENLFKYHRTNLIIEEPEQNLFPATQKELAYKLLEYLNRSERGHTFTLTTHSPYILYAINNCILTYLVKDKVEEALPNLKSAISPNDINLFEIENGKNRSIKGENGLIGDNYFDQKMKEVMDDFYQSLNYL